MSYPYVEEKILYDPTGIAKSLIDFLKRYFQDNEEVLKVWQNWTKEYLEFKKKGINRTDEEIINSCNSFYDSLEIKFSKKHKVTRDF
ncbi:MAG: hypothetical protein ACOCXG_05690 [Nanoarchaeota archaeon]